MNPDAGYLHVWLALVLPAPEEIHYFGARGNQDFKHHGRFLFLRSFWNCYPLLLVY